MKIKIPEFLKGTEEEEQLITTQLKIQSERKQAQQIKTGINRISQKNGAVLNIVEMLVDALIEYVPTKLPNVKDVKNCCEGKTLVIGDMHFDGSQSSLSDMARLKKIMSEQKFSKVIFGGDTLDGAIRASDRFKGALPPEKQVILFFDLFNGILSNLDYKPKFYILYGNHEEIRQFGDEFGDETASWAEVLANTLSIAGYEVEHGTRLYDKENKIYLVHGDKDPRVLTNIVVDTDIKYTVGKTSFQTNGIKLKRNYKTVKINSKNVEKVFRFHFHFGLMENKDGIDYVQFPSFYSGNRPYDIKIGKKSLAMYGIIDEKGGITFGK